MKTARKSPRPKSPRSSRRAADSIATTPETQSMYGGGAGSGYDGANASNRRGYVYFPTLDTRRELTQFSRVEMLRRARYLVRNVGYAKRCTYGLAQMAGSLHPRPFTDDREWNALALSVWDRRAERANTCDIAGRHSAWSIQPVITQSRLIDGDFGIVLTESVSGAAMFAAYEGHQIGSGYLGADAAWKDGVYVPGQRPLAYRLIDPSDPAKFTDVPAENFIHCADFLSVGHVRGASALHHAINNLLDITEIRSDVKLGIKIANRLGLVITRQVPQSGASPKGMGVKTTTETTASGDTVLTEDLYTGGKILRLGMQEEIKTLLDQRPHPNSREFLEDLNRDIACGLNMSPDVLWNIAKLGGASVRYVLADAQITIEAQQQLLVDQFLHRYYVYALAKEMKYGRLRPCTDPEWFWKVGWQPRERMTVDIGRDGKLSIDLHRAGMLTLKRWYGAQGFNEEDELRQYVREYALKVKIVKEISAEMGVPLDFDKVFAPAAGSTFGAPATVDPAAADLPEFGDPAAIQQVMVELRDHLAHLRAA